MNNKLISFTLIALFSLALLNLKAQAKEVPAYTGEKALVATEVPQQLEGVGISEHLGQDLDLNLPVVDENGTHTTLGSFFDGKTPLIISPVYYSCPGLCNFHLNGLTEALKQVDWSPGKQFKVLAVSFDSKETAVLAQAKKANYMKIYDRAEAESGWHFLTLDEPSVKAFTQKLGFNFKWNPESKEWSHASAAIVVTPQGKISRYLPGIMFEPRDVKLALNEATEGRIGNFIEGLVLYCFQYNPHASKYTLAAMNVMKLGGLIMLLLLAIWLIPIWFRNKRELKTGGR